MISEPNQPETSGRNVEHRIGARFEVAATPDQVWEAITTASGIAAWMVPSRVEEREGGEIAFNLHEDLWSVGHITTFDAPHVLRYVEPDWAEIAGHGQDSISPMATEFLIEAQSGGTCIVRMVTSVFGTGADWENEFFTDMSNSWLPLIDNLRLYVAHFAGLPVTMMHLAHHTLDGDSVTIKARLVNALDIADIGQIVDTPNGPAVVERYETGPILLRLAAALIEIEMWPTESDVACVLTARQFPPSEPFSPDDWQHWLTGLVVRT